MADNQSISNYLVVSDLDGTLLKASVGVPPVNTEAILAFNAEGGRFTIATGRTLPSVQRYIHQMGGLSAPAVMCNGALIYDFEKDQVVREVHLPFETAKEAVLQILGRFSSIGVEVMSGKKIFILKNNAVSHRHTGSDGLQYTLIDIDHIPHDWYKVLFCIEKEQMDELEVFANSLGLPGIYFVRTGECYLELMSEGVDKGSALDYLLEFLGIPIDRLIAIGDYYNDIPMLEKAAFSVCMGDSPDRVKLKCDMVVKPCLEGGVAQFLNYFKNHVPLF